MFSNVPKLEQRKSVHTHRHTHTHTQTHAARAHAHTHTHLLLLIVHKEAKCIVYKMHAHDMTCKHTPTHTAQNKQHTHTLSHPAGPRAATEEKRQEWEEEKQAPSTAGGPQWPKKGVKIVMNCPLGDNKWLTGFVRKCIVRVPSCTPSIGQSSISLFKWLFGDISHLQTTPTYFSGNLFWNLGFYDCQICVSFITSLRSTPLCNLL